MIRQATILSREEADAVFRIGRHSGRPPIYPWDEWFDGQARIFTLADHFPGFKSYPLVTRYIYRLARRRNVKVEIRRMETGAFTLRATTPLSRREEGTDAPNENLEDGGTHDRRSIRHTAASVKRGKQQSSKRKR